MYIPGTISEWEDWIKMKFYEINNYVIQGALEPIKINLEKYR